MSTPRLTSEERELLERLESVRGLADETEWNVFLTTLDRLRGTESPAVLAALFALFRDDDPLDAPQYLLHVVEASRAELYVPALVAATPRMMREARFWAGVLHMRVLQAPDYLRLYAAGLVRQSPEHRAACEEAFCEALESRPDLRREADAFHAVVAAAEES